MAVHRGNNRSQPKLPKQDTVFSVSDIIEDLTNEDSGALLWSENGGLRLMLPESVHQHYPMPLYLLGICFVRLTTDSDFASELLDWYKRNQN